MCLTVSCWQSLLDNVASRAVSCMHSMHSMLCVMSTHLVFFLRHLKYCACVDGGWQDMLVTVGAGDAGSGQGLAECHCDGTL